jgi:hypothetical protein
MLPMSRWRTVDPVFLIPALAILTAVGYLAVSSSQLGHGSQVVTPTYPPSDPAALALLRRMEAAMNTLKSLKAIQVGSDDSGHRLTTTMLYAAPDRVYLETSTGERAIVIGGQQWNRDPGHTLWQLTQRARPLAFPDFHEYGPTAVNVQMGPVTEISGRPAPSVSFFLPTASGPILFEAIADPVTYRFQTVRMVAPGHHMNTEYVGFNADVSILPPRPEQVAPSTAP